MIDIGSTLQTIAVILLPLIFAITIHEAAHGFVANKLGDRTAWLLGRVTLNPIKHIDPWGTVILPLIMLIISHFSFAFGWAKPVPITAQNLRNPRRDMASVAVAGPSSNLIMALLWAAIAKAAALNMATAPIWLSSATHFFYLAGLFGLQFNCLLCLLNLLPIPPLDGSRIVSALLPRRLAYQYDFLENYGLWILLILFALGILSRLIMPPTVALITTIRALFNL